MADFDFLEGFDTSGDWGFSSLAIRVHRGLTSLTVRRHALVNLMLA